MSGFKLLAIRPLEGCDEKYRKNLIPGQIYQFYQDYSITPELDPYGNKPVAVNHQATVPEDLYHLTCTNGSPINLHISAIVGKNGSGKSSILELFYGMIYLLAEQEGLLKEDGIQHLKKELESDRKIKEEPSNWKGIEMLDTKKIIEIQKILNKKEDSSYKISEIQTLLNPKKLHTDPTEKIAYNERRLKALESFLEELKAEVFFLLDGNYFKLTTSCEKNLHVGLFNITDQEWVDSKIVSSFFYSVAINYSIHGLNARYTGEWINPLFHKNDAYQTPLVINPMRINGDIDINNEEYLAKSRLLANTLKKTNDQYNLLLTEKQEIHRLFFFLNERKVDIVYEEEQSGSTANPKFPVTFEEFYKGYVIVPNYKNPELLLFQKIYEILFDHNVEINAVADQYREVPHHDFVKKYILKKLVKIARKKGYGYEEYFIKERTKSVKVLDGFSLIERPDKKGNLMPSIFENYLLAIKQDKSHITLKLRQAINYLKNNPLTDSKNQAQNTEEQWLSLKDKYDTSNRIKQYVISAEKLADKLEGYQADEIIDLLPPSLFDVNIEMRNTDNSEISSFNRLSSGEVQHIHSIHSILYHLNNLNSVFYKPIDDARQSYSNINIILDEIELYFHPDFQRKFISDLRSGIQRLNIGGKGENQNPIGIQHINILLATHSPFILSDIPSQNVLRLKNGEPIGEPEKGTFGANVHDLLHDSFFLEEGFMGKFAEEKINEVINWINHELLEQKISILQENIEKSERNLILKEKLILEKTKLQNQKMDLLPKSETLIFNDCFLVVNLIGEPALQSKLLSMLYEINPTEEIDYLREINAVKKKYGKE